MLCILSDLQYKMTSAVSFRGAFDRHSQCTVLLLDKFSWFAYVVLSCITSIVGISSYLGHFEE